MPDYSHVVIGGGVVGLAITARLARAGFRVLLVEKNAKLGQETSSRNSEVVHAGLYYPPDSLKLRLCLRGKQLIYDATKRGLPDVRQCGKWLVAQTDAEADYLTNLKAQSNLTGVPLHWVPLDRAKQLEPAVRARRAVLESPTTGILSAHSLMDWLEAQIQDVGGDIVTHSAVTGITDNYTVEIGDTKVTTEAVINAAGHGAVAISNMVRPDLGLKAYYAKGSYYAYPLSQPKVGRLVYPCPNDHGSLGTHLTLDLAGRIKFGPSFKWVDSPNDLAPDPLNFSSVSEFIDLDTSKLVPDYAGIRPRITKDTSQFQDFVIREDRPGFVNLLAIESPGLTSSLAIAEYVYDLLH